MGWLDRYFQSYGLVQSNGSPLPKQGTLNFIGATVADDPANNRTTITITGGGGGTTPTGSGFRHVAGGTEDAAASRGSANQVAVTNAAGTDTEWMSIGGGAIGGTIDALTVLAITGSGGVCGIGTAAATLRWVGSTVNPKLTQVDNATGFATGQTLTIQAQSCTGGHSVGGDLVLASGTGTGNPGSVTIQSDTFASVIVAEPGVQLTAGATTVIDVAEATITLGAAALDWADNVSSPTLSQLDATADSVNGQDLLIAAQTAEGATTTGGDLRLSSGGGTDANGTVSIESAGVQQLAISDDTINIKSTTVTNTSQAKGSLTQKTFHAQTTTATTTSIYSFSLATDTQVSLSVEVQASQNGSSHLTNAATYKRWAVFKNNNGTVSQVGTTQDTGTLEDVAGWDVTITNPSGTTISVNAVSTAVTIEWDGIAQKKIGTL